MLSRDGVALPVADVLTEDRREREGPAAAETEGLAEEEDAELAPLGDVDVAEGLAEEVDAGEELAGLAAAVYGAEKKRNRRIATKVRKTCATSRGRPK